MAQTELKNKLYCLRIIGWIDKEPYSNKEYFFALGEEDPLIYKFPKHVKIQDAIERSKAVRADIDSVEKIPKHIVKTVAQRRADAR
jgi:hypothetical protein